MKFTAYVFAAFITAQVGVYLADLSTAYFDSVVEKRVVARMEEYKVKGKPAYCSFYQ